MKNFVKRHITWPLKVLRKDLRYFRDECLNLLRKKETDHEPLVKLYKDGLQSSHDRPICLFCSYDKENIVRENVYYYLNQLLLAGFDIIFISTSDTIAEIDLERLSKCCVKIINRENRGYDFYGWKTGLEKYPQHQSHTGLLLANDSVLGPLFDMTDIVTRLESCNADIVGMTNCFHFHPHLQSYFIYCKKHVIISEEFQGFFRKVDVQEPKIAIIRKFEVGFSRRLGRRFRIAALYDLTHVMEQVNYDEKPIKWVNPTFHLWKSLIIEFKFPFLKKNLLTNNKVTNFGEISKVLANHTNYNRDMLRDWNLSDHPKPEPSLLEIR